MTIANISSVAATIDGGFVVGVLTGYALKKMVKLIAVVVGLFFAGLAYLRYLQIININWNKLQVAAQNTLSTLAITTTMIPGVGNISHTAFSVFTNLGTLTGSMSIGFAIGFMKG